MRAQGHTVLIGHREDAGIVRAAALAEEFECLSLAATVRRPAEIRHLHLHNSLDARALPLLAGWRLRSGAAILTEHLPRTPRTELVWPASIPGGGRARPGMRAAKTLVKRLEYRAATATIAVSSASAEFMSRRWRLPVSSLVVVHNGVGDFWDPRQTPLPASRSLKLVAVGEQHVLKGYDILLDALGLVREPVSLTLVGTGLAQDDLRSRADRLPERHSVTFAGRQTDPTRLIRDAEVLCAPSRYESFSYVILEAMANGKAVIAADVDGASEAVLHGETGLLVGADDAAGLASAIEQLASAPELRREMGVNGLERARREFGVADMVARTVEVYASAMLGPVRA